MNRSLQRRDLTTLDTLCTRLGRNPTKKECAAVGLHFSHSSGFSSRADALEALGRPVDRSRKTGNYKTKDLRMVSDEQANPTGKTRRCQDCYALTTWAATCQVCGAIWRRCA